MTKRFWTIVCILLGSVSSTALAQTTKFPRRQYVVDVSRPSVYITQEDALSNVSASKEKVGSRLFYRLHNNLRWPIRLTVSSPPAGEGDVQLDYELLGKSDQVAGGYECHKCTAVPLGSGKSLLFSLSENEVRSSKRIRVAFSFWWESFDDVGTEMEPFHYVLMTFADK